MRRVEIPLGGAHFEIRSPVGQPVQGDPGIGDDFFRGGKNPVVKNDDAVLHDGPGLPDGVAEIHLAFSVGGQILDEKHPLPLFQIALNLALAPESLFFLANVDHRLVVVVREPCGERNARSLPARDDVESLSSDVRVDFPGGDLHDLAALARGGDDFPAIHIDRAGPAGGENIRLLEVAVDRLNLEKKFRHPVFALDKMNAHDL